MENHSINGWFTGTPLLRKHPYSKWQVANEFLSFILQRCFPSRTNTDFCNMSLQMLRNPAIHFLGSTLTLTYYLEVYIWHIYSERLSHILSGIYSDIMSDSFSDRLSGVYSDILSAILSRIYSDIPSLTSIPAFYLASVPSSRYGLGPGVDKGRRKMTRRGQARSEGVSERGSEAHLCENL